MAIKLFKLFKAKSSTPLSAEVTGKLQQARALKRDGQSMEAAEAYRVILEETPGHWESVDAIASSLLQSGNPEEAVKLYTNAIAHKIDNAEAYYRRANALGGLGRLEAALADYNQATKYNPEYANAHCNSAAIMLRLGHWDEALASIDRALILAPNDAFAHFNKGSILRALKRPSEALASYAQAVAVKIDYVEAHFYRGDVLRELKRYDEAVASYDRVIEFSRENTSPFLAYSSRGFALMELRLHEKALESFENSIALKSNYVEGYIDRGNILQELGRYEKAIDSYDEAIKLNPSHFLAYCNRGSVLRKLQRNDEALASYDHAIALKNDSVEAHINRGNVLLELQRYQDAVQSYDIAIGYNPAKTLAHAAYSGRGIALRQLRRFEDALNSYENAIAAKDDDVEAYMNRGGILQELQRHETAVQSYERAIALQPDYAEAFQGRAFSLLALKLYEAAIASFDETLRINPTQKYMSAFRRYVQMQVCDWTDLDQYISALERGLMARNPVSAPFQVLALLDSAALQRLAAEIWTQEECPADDNLGAIGPRPRTDRIRIGYFSADFRNHPVSLLTAELFETHDRSKFEVTGFAFGPKTSDSVRARLEQAFERFIDVSEESDNAVAMAARNLGIDIAVDLGGFTEHSRTKIFAARAAPIQMSYIGYLGTMGASYMDYLVADETLVPLDSRKHYAEKLVYLPSYQANDSRRRASLRSFSRVELGLPTGGFVFSCFNTNYKITPTTFNTWMRILKRVENSSLFLYAGNEIARRNLLKETQNNGVDPRRVVFGQQLPLDEYLARFRTMDLFLDTLPYNAGTTASDALWAGLPVLTCAGNALAGRVAASLLTALDMPELITTTEAQYEELAIRLALSPEKMASIREKLERNRATTLLFDTVRFTRNLEYAYTQIYERYQANLPPEDIHRNPAL